MTDHPQEHESLDSFVAKVEASAVDVMRETLKDARTAVDASLEAVRMLRDQQQARGRQALNLIADRLDVASSKLYEATQYTAYTQAQRDAYAAEAVKQERERGYEAVWTLFDAACRDVENLAKTPAYPINPAWRLACAKMNALNDALKAMRDIRKDQP